MKLFSQELKHAEHLDAQGMRPLEDYSISHLNKVIQQSWQTIAPAWPLKNIIAVNPLMGFQELPFEQAVEQASHLFQQGHLPLPMLDINRVSIKWLQAFYDQGQASIAMPMRHLGLLNSCVLMLQFDHTIVSKGSWQQRWLMDLSQDPIEVIAECLNILEINPQEHQLFLSLILSTLPGWAAYTQYRCQWADVADAQLPYPVSHADYLALRLVITCLVWRKAKDILVWYRYNSKQSKQKEKYQQFFNQLQKNESNYQQKLLSSLSNQSKPTQTTRADAQLAFCIDVRSEPFRRAFEATGNYQTLGFAGFFGLPIALHDSVTDEQHASCPVLLKPAHTVEQSPCCHLHDHHEAHQRIEGLKRIFQSLKYTFAAPFNLVETLGPITGLWMGIKSIFPSTSVLLKTKLRQQISPDHDKQLDCSAIPKATQLQYAANALTMMGLTENFAAVVMFCGHGSSTQNNAYATALDCGACGGRHGGGNARVLANMLNDAEIRHGLAEMGIHIPADTTFVGAEHNTTTDELDIYEEDILVDIQDKLAKIKADLLLARDRNSAWRLARLYPNKTTNAAAEKTKQHALDWAQTRPEWGLSGNASFIVGPHWLTEKVDLQGRSFLHSYEWQKDPQLQSLNTILTAPMVVAQWINSQYFFSTLDNVAYGAGSKVSKNIVGKLGVMQGNASDLMNGLPLQSVFIDDQHPYHQCLRLSVMVYAPKQSILSVIQQQAILQQLFGNGWVHLFCIDPELNQTFTLSRELQWMPLN